MPFRYTSLRAAPCVRTGLFQPSWNPIPFQYQQRRCFRPSNALRDDEDTELNHYETLNVHPDASPADIKKSFYSLSKTHHPDHNPGNPHAPKRFMRISEAYSVLSHAEKRARYDRDVMRRRYNNPGKHNTPHNAHQHATGPAGGRPASGLSRRRGSFKGPPPSFFRSGGWGSQSAKRKAAHEESTGYGGNTGGMGPGSDPLHRTTRTSGFDSEAHEAQQRRQQERMASRREVETPIVDVGLLFQFFVVGGIIAAVAYIPYWMMGVSDGKQVRKRTDAMAAKTVKA